LFAQALFSCLLLLKMAPIFYCDFVGFESPWQSIDLVFASPDIGIGFFVQSDLPFGLAMEDKTDAMGIPLRTRQGLPIEQKA
jgi:hypothetical protein